MRILLIAYDFPPTQSPRALRWRYLVRELALLGNDIHVLTPDLGEPGIEFPRMPGSVTIHRTFPGPYGWLVRTANRKRLGNESNGNASPPTSVAARLNWRGRAVDACKRLAGLVLFPDIRAEWGPWARPALRQLLADIRPEVVITSHEPASTLPLGVLAKQSGFIWVADLGDPVCAAYTPRRWLKRAMTLEARVTALADTVLVTNEATRSLLIDRHGQQPHRCVVLPNGYDDRRTNQGPSGAGTPDFDDDRLELVYAGRLYGYRDPTPLLQAVAASTGVRLTLVVPDPPPGTAGDAMTEAAGDRLRILGPMPHAQVQAMLERADVLVNFGDHGQPVRIAAKVYEYLGIARPILHVHAGESDAAASLLRDLNRGWLCAEDSRELTALLTQLHKRKQGGRLHRGLALARVNDYAHSTLGVRLAAILEKAATGTKGSLQRQLSADDLSPPAGQRMHATTELESQPTRLQVGALRRLGGRTPEELEHALATSDAQIQQLRLEAKRSESEIRILNQRLDLMDSQIRELHASSSWRVTAPLRYLAETARGMVVTVRNGGRTHLRRLPTRSPATRLAALEGKDTFVLYRIIGNDLTPRHRRGQTIDNLRFILEHEPSLEGCEKRFVVNRILDPDQEREIISLLAASGFEYIRIPFEASEYARIGFDMEALPEPGFLMGERVDSLGQVERERLFMALYRLKNNYVMNNNGARNAALEDGRGRAKWILPWDGNCFLTHEAWQQIRRGMAKSPTNRYFIVPMVRMPSNEPLVAGGEIPKALEEPQIVFRTDAVERFDEAFCYGRRPKVELLWRLGVRGPWDDYPDDPWDQARAPVSPEAAAVGRAGWVARLSSGVKTLEANSEQAPLHRGVARSGAILSTLRHLDMWIAGTVPEQPVSIRREVLAREIEGQDVPPLRDVVRALIQAADESVETASPGLLDAFDDSLKLVLAWSFTGEARYAEGAVDILGRSFLHPDTRLTAHDSANDPARMEGLHHYLDAVRILEGAGLVPASAKAGFRAWLDERLHWLSASPNGALQRRASDHRGTGHDLQVVSIAAFLDNHDLVYESLVRAQDRISSQFAADGSQPTEVGGPGAVHRCCLNFQYWIYLAELASRWGVDLWGYQTPHGSGLAQGACWLISRVDEPWPSGRVEGLDITRFQPIRFAARGFADGLPDDPGGTDLPYAFRPEFARGTGVRPFWNLASYGQG